MYHYLIALGSNLGDRHAAIRTALEHLQVAGLTIDSISHMYETEPVGNADKLFLNGACVATSALEPEAAMQLLLRIERDLGRVRLLPASNRTIDLDLIMAKDDLQRDVVIRQQGLTLPHPRAAERDFVIRPCSDVCPDWVLPGQPLSFSELRLDVVTI